MLNKECLFNCESISFSYGKRKIFSQLSFCIKPKEFWVISGESGIGKTTLLKVITGEIKNTSGQIKRPQYFTEIPQGLGLCSGLSAYETIAAGSLQEIPWWQSLFCFPLKTMNKALEISQTLKIDHVIHNNVEQLSGGERQRVVMARSLMGKSRLFIVDEPISMLDESRAIESLLLLRDEVFRRGGALVCVLHQSHVISQFATHQLIMTSESENGWVLK